MAGAAAARAALSVLITCTGVVAATFTSAAAAQHHSIPTLTATASDFHQGGWPFSAAYLANGFVGLRVGPRAIVRNPYAGGTEPTGAAGNARPPVESTLIGGFLQMSHEMKGAPTPPAQSDGTDTYCPAPYPFETEVVVTPDKGRAS